MTTYKDLLRMFNNYNIPFSNLFQKFINWVADTLSVNEPEEYTYEELCELMDNNKIQPNKLYKMNYTPLIISDVYESDNNIYEIVLKGKTYNKFYDEVKINSITTNDILNYNEIKLIKPLIINCTSSSSPEIKSITLRSISILDNRIYGRVTDSTDAQYPPIELYLSDLPELIEVLKDDYVNTTISLNKTITPVSYVNYFGSLTLIDTVNVEAECDKTLNTSDLNMNGVYNFDRDYKYGIKNKLIKSIKNNVDIYAKPILSENEVVPGIFESNLYFLKETDTEIVFTTKTSDINNWCELVVNKNNYKFGTIITASIHIYMNKEYDGKIDRNFILYNPKSYNGYITNINYKTENNISVDIDYDFFNYIKVLNDVKYKYFNKTIPVLLKSDYNIILKSDTAIPYTFIIKNNNINFNFDIYSYNSHKNIIELSKFNEHPRFNVSGKINLNTSDNNTIVIYDSQETYNINIDFSNSHDNNILITYKNTTIKDCAFYNCNEIDHPDALYKNIYRRSSMTFINCCNGSVDVEWLSENIILENIGGNNFSIEFKTENPWANYCRGLTHIRNISENSKFALEIYNAAQSVPTYHDLIFDGFDGIFIPSGAFVHKWIAASHRLYDIVPFDSYNAVGNAPNNTGYKFQSEINNFITID